MPNEGTELGEKQDPPRKKQEEKAKTQLTNPLLHICIMLLLVSVSWTAMGLSLLAKSQIDAKRRKYRVAVAMPMPCVDVK